MIIPFVVEEKYFFYQWIPCTHGNKIQFNLEKFVKNTGVDRLHDDNHLVRQFLMDKNTNRTKVIGKQ